MKEFRFSSKLALAFIAPLYAFSAVPANALVIDNDIAAGTLGEFSVNLTTGGESREAYISANRLASGDVFREDLLFDYYSYVDVGNGGIRLSGTAPVSGGDDTATSGGTFLGAGGNTIGWSVTSAIADGDNTMTSVFNFTAEQGSLGDIRFFQYLDEDIQSVSDDVFFTRGSAATLDLELYTVDNTEVYGVSHSGALDGSQGLVDSTFAGWSACTYNTMKPAIGNGTQTVSTLGDVCGSLAGTAFNHAELGSVYGPRDIVSVLAWDVLSNATSATIITTLGGVPDVRDIPTETTVPEPTTLALFGAGLLMLRSRRKN